MYKLAHVKLKAAILFIVFGLHTGQSLACNVDFDCIIGMVLHLTHQHGEKEVTDKLAHHENSKYNHDQDETDKDDCCNAKVVSFDQLDKVISHQITANFSLPVIDLPYYMILNARLCLGASYKVLSDIFLNFHAPPEDIRVSIRSFQI